MSILRIVRVSVIAMPLLMVACRDSSGSASIPHDFTTPEGAILCLEDAYRNKDIEAAVRAKDFRMEAKLMLTKLRSLPEKEIDDELIKKTAEVLELGFRNEKRKDGFAEMKGVRSTFPKKEPHKENIVVVTEKCYYPEGGTSVQRILVGKGEKGWRVLNPLE
jgi:hypothetical protein